MKSILSLMLVIFYCPHCFAQDGLERLKEFEVESYSTSLPCSFNFEMICLSSRPNAPQESEQLLGSVMKDGKGATRVDYEVKDIVGGSSHGIFHSLRISPKERFAAYRSGKSVQFLPLEEDVGNPIRLVDVDPFRLIFFPVDAVFNQSPKSADLSMYLKRYTEIRNTKNDKFRYFRMPNGLFVNRILFEDSTSAKILEVSTFVSPDLPTPPKDRKNNPRDIYSSDQTAGFKLFKSTKVTWTEVESIGILPETISAFLSGHIVQEPEREHEIQFRFFNYNFDKEKLDFSLCTREAFTKEKLVQAFDAKSIRLELEKTNFGSSSRSRSR